jgi:allophanate hydrolase
MSLTKTLGWTLIEWQQAYQTGLIQLEDIQHLFGALSDEDSAWISLCSPEVLNEQLDALRNNPLPISERLAQRPLYGIPFAVKDNIDVAGFYTTAACPEARYLANQDAFVIEQLKKAGAIVIGKTNLDQFATGLVGTRSPYGAVANTFNPEYVSGGSSSGSASVVARGLVPFALGTDTAGSGRVPAGFNNIVGLKPTKGWFSNTGLVPACKTLDCISIFALSVDDADYIAQIMGKFDPADDYARQNPKTAPARFSSQLTFAVPKNPQFYGDTLSEEAFNNTIAAFRSLNASIEEIDFSAFEQLALQLYQASWVAERTAAVGSLLDHRPEVFDPTVYQIIKQGQKFSAVDAYNAEYMRADLARKIQQLLAPFDALIVPTSPTIRTIAEMAEKPIEYNAQFGTYTNFTNLADLSALALPAGFRADGLPFGITLIAPAWHDTALAHFGRTWQHSIDLTLGALAHKKLPNSCLPSSLTHHIRVAVVGAHLTGMPLNFQLTTRNAVHVETTTTAAKYRLYALNGTVPPKPGLARNDATGSSIIVELWDIPSARFGEFVAEIPTPLGMGNVELIDGRWVKGFICEPYGIHDAKDVSSFGGWRAYIQNHIQDLKQHSTAQRDK